MTPNNSAGDFEFDAPESSQLSEQDPRARHSSCDAASTYLHSDDDRLAASLAGLLPLLTKWAPLKRGLGRIDAFDKAWQSAGTPSSKRRGVPSSTGSEDEAAFAESTGADRRPRAKNSPEESLAVPEARSPSPRLVEAARNCLRHRISDVLGATTRGAARGEQSDPSSTSSRTRAVQSPQQRTNGAGKRKATERAEGPGDDSDADDVKKRHKGHPEKSPGVIRDRFACPCFKRDPQLYGLESDCASHSWDIRRLKDCATPTGVDRDRPAQLARQKYGRIMDKERFKRLSGHAKWFVIFEILYPEVPRAEYPSPYHERSSVEGFLRFALQQTPLHLPTELDQLALDMGSEDARDRVTEVVKGFLCGVYDNYRDSQRLTSSTTLRAQNSLALEPADPLPNGQAAPETTVDPIAPGVRCYVEALLPSGFANEETTLVLPGQTAPSSRDFEERTGPPFDGLPHTADNGLDGLLGFDDTYTPDPGLEPGSAFWDSGNLMEAEGELFR
ncbi:hypothetical protein DL762_004855 [Monosporascus cannonballus]|uniref:Restriction of telomere capping protein 4 n=1 Tax=Monosporascus cannonballus TaxID=155416 RepID=A0ABY0H751_9PEZI|nr:hypothetical protein DL762_004855 [Monosporascus cannonballus]